VVHLTRRYWFCASHRLHNPALAEQENRQLYGKCNNRGGHGHNYHLELTVAGPIDIRTGMVVDLGELDAFVQQRVLERFDQTHLNDEATFQSRVPTTENLCMEIYHIVKDGWSSLPSARRAALERVRLEETASNFFEYRGEVLLPAKQPAPKQSLGRGELHG
jgi:6-pyruvoyltetrahydropterin/6-carboxytetrahydropterin synthase